MSGIPRTLGREKRADLDYMSIAAEVACEILLCDVGSQTVQPNTCCGHTLSKTQLQRRPKTQDVKTLAIIIAEGSSVSLNSIPFVPTWITRGKGNIDL
jgi:hypothetical protein